MLSSEKHAVVWVDVNLLIFQTESRHHFLGLAHVLRHFMRFQKDIADQFHEIVIAIVGEEILGLNDHQRGDGGKEGHFCVFMRLLFRSLKNASTSAVGGSSVTSACITSIISSILSTSPTSQSCSSSATTLVSDSP
jgi:hypothetical protein